MLEEPWSRDEPNLLKNVFQIPNPDKLLMFNLTLDCRRRKRNESLSGERCKSEELSVLCFSNRVDSNSFV